MQLIVRPPTPENIPTEQIILTLSRLPTDQLTSLQTLIETTPPQELTEKTSKTIEKQEINILKPLLTILPGLANAQHNDKPLLHYAVDSPEITTLLLQHGADINATDKDGKTILHHVMRMKEIDLEQLEIILKAKADITKFDKSRVYTPLHLAMSFDTFINKHKAFELIEEHYSSQAITTALQLTNRNGNTPLSNLMTWMEDLYNKRDEMSPKKIQLIEKLILKYDAQMGEYIPDIRMLLDRISNHAIKALLENGIIIQNRTIVRLLILATMPRSVLPQTPAEIKQKIATTIEKAENLNEALDTDTKEYLTQLKKN